MTKLNVLSLFDGMSCARIALDKLGIPCTYYASEVDQYAIKVAKANYPDTIHLGSVTDVKWNDKHPIDLLVGGSPCQGFSFAGKRLNFDDPRSKLFWEYVRVLKETRPRYFLLENVRMKQQSQDVITEALGVEPVSINSNLVSAQNRHRLYWSNIPFNIPDDRGIVLQDILEYGMTDREKSHCLDANYFKGGNLKSYFEKNRRQLVFNDVVIAQRPRGANRGGLRALDGKSPSLSISSWEQNNFLVHTDNLKWRKLTPIECERLQTVPDNYTNHVSNTQRYKMLGNGFTVDIIAHILKGMEL
jgi:site-specific DNA-cytosine methylase